MQQDELLFFEQMPDALPLYEAVQVAFSKQLPPYTVVVHKTQITFRNKYGFAFVSLPLHGFKNRPAVCIVLSFGLAREETNPRIALIANPYKNRFTHHMLIAHPQDVDTQVLAWVQEAYDFANTK